MEGSREQHTSQPNHQDVSAPATPLSSSQATIDEKSVSFPGMNFGPLRILFQFGAENPQPAQSPLGSPLAGAAEAAAAAAAVSHSIPGASPPGTSATSPTAQTLGQEKIVPEVPATATTSANSSATGKEQEKEPDAAADDSSSITTSTTTTTTEKHCSVCGHTKPLSQFLPKQVRRGGYNRECRACRSKDDEKKRKRYDERARAAGPLGLVVCIRCIKAYPRAHFQADHPKGREGGDKRLTKRCIICRLGSRKQFCEKCDEELSASEKKAGLAAKGGQTMLCAACSPSPSSSAASTEVTPEPGLASASSRAASTGEAGVNDQGNNGSTTTTSPPSSELSPSVEPDTGSAKKRGPQPLSPERNPSAAKKGRFADTKETLGDEVEAKAEATATAAPTTAAPVTSPDPGVIASADKGGETSEQTSSSATPKLPPLELLLRDEDMQNRFIQGLGQFIENFRSNETKTTDKGEGEGEGYREARERDCG
ncbi:hypothetical protein PG994_013624 [Apiospora phragmitis]|uniref:Stc1 domain-containing protein n=1 Tax=Apiospora phragmitis TaxID=2905665 RepID=A0ABR1T960_9PEZI